MTKFEYLVNGGSFASNTINVVVIDLNKDETFSADINANTLAEVDSKLPEGYEMDKISTLSNYFEPSTMEQYSIELDNSQYVYFANFHNEVTYGIYDYIEAIENDLQLMERIDRKYSK